ncbi:MAG TPA: nucleotidyltransferase family protein [Terriglobales bacterium]|nr:nucleotidyltransferase family protein [Terriglobales bacterium]
MRAMVLAAGLGTRLRPLTDDRPKALVEVAGRSLLEITLARLRAFGIREVIVNVHHFADQVVSFLRAHDNFGMRLEISPEDVLLDTGGGLKNVAHFFPSQDEPFLVHNVDVISTIDLGKLVQAHAEKGGLATLAVQDRKTSRYLLFDPSGRLCGRRAGTDGRPEMARAASTFNAFAFAGIHVISPRLLKLMTEEGSFPIVPCYLRLVAAGENIFAFRADQYYWRDLGKPENLMQAAEDVEHGLLKI